MFVVELSILCLLCLSILFFILLRKNKNYWKWRGVPFEEPLPLVGNMLDVILMRRNMPLMMADLYFKYADHQFFGMWIFTEPHLVVRCPELIKLVLIKDFDNFHNRNVQSNEKVDPLAANMLFFMRNPKWKVNRTVTTPMFSSAKMKYVFPQIQAVAKNMAAFIDIRMKKPICANHLVVKYSTDVICSVAFGVDSHSFQDRPTPFTSTAKEVFEVSLRNTATAATYFSKNHLVNIFRIKFIKTSIANFLSDTFLHILNEREKGNTKRRDLLDTMIKHRHEFKFTDHELVAQASEFFFAGYETTSSTIMYAIYELSVNTEIQNKLRQEINANIESNDEFSYDTLKEMPYLHKVVSETLRKYPVIPFLGRVCVKDYKIPNSNVVVEKGTPIMIPLMGLHHDPQYFPNPEKFDPERFSAENVRERNPYCYLPFGEGQRQCIGLRTGLLSVKLAVAHLIRNFEMEIADKSRIPLQFIPETFLLHTDPFDIHFKKISTIEDRFGN